MRLTHRFWCGPNEPSVTGPVWHDDDLPDPITWWCDARMDQVDHNDRHRHRSNLVRWWLLAELGGLWLDHDATLHADPPPGDWVAGVGLHACAAAIQLEPGHPLAWAMLAHFETLPPSRHRAPAVSGQAPLAAFAPVHQVRLEQIPGPGAPATWISHRWDTSRKARR